MAMTYAWKAGSRVGIDAQSVGETLEELRARDGGFTAPAVLEEARPETSRLHPAFEWDDTKAAEEYRLDQARYLIRSVVVIRHEEEDNAPMLARAFVVVNDGGEHRYTSVDVALSDDGMRKQVLADALKELRAWQSRYSELKELAAVFAAAEKVSAAKEGVA